MGNDQNKRSIKICSKYIDTKRFIKLSMDAKVMLIGFYDWLEFVGKLKKGAKLEVQIDDLVKNSGMTERTIVKTLTELESAGFITKEE